MGNVVDKILFLMDSEGVSGNKLTRSLGISSSSITEWKQGKMKPSVEAIVKIAKYFKVTTDYLLYDEVDLPLHSPSKITDDEIMVLNRVRELKNDGYSMEEINLALSLSKQALRIAEKWESLDYDGQFMVGGALIQEERRVSVEKKENLA